MKRLYFPNHDKLVTSGLYLRVGHASQVFLHSSVCTNIGLVSQQTFGFISNFLWCKRNTTLQDVLLQENNQFWDDNRDSLSHQHAVAARPLSKKKKKALYSNLDSGFTWLSCVTLTRFVFLHPEWFDYVLLTAWKKIIFPTHISQRIWFALILYESIMLTLHNSIK